MPSKTVSTLKGKQGISSLFLVTLKNRSKVCRVVDFLRWLYLFKNCLKTNAKFSLLYCILKK